VDEPEPGSGEAERDGAADAVGGAGDDGLGAVAAAEGLAGAEERGVDLEREADGGEGTRRPTAASASAQAGCARRNSTWAHVPAIASPDSGSWGE
jgi:hypothetical protein